MKKADHAKLIIPGREDSREICFEQGKRCVCEPDDEPGISMTEWPNGIIDRWDGRTDTETRHQPNGTAKTVRDNTPPPRSHAHAEESPR